MECAMNTGPDGLGVSGSIKHLGPLVWGWRPAAGTILCNININGEIIKIIFLQSRLNLVLNHALQPGCPFFWFLDPGAPKTRIHRQTSTWLPLARVQATGERLREAQHINRSLSALADVVVAKENPSRFAAPIWVNLYLLGNSRGTIELKSKCVIWTTRRLTVIDFLQAPLGAEDPWTWALSTNLADVDWRQTAL